MISFRADDEIVSMIDENRGDLTSSQFIRRAIDYYIQSLKCNGSKPDGHGHAHVDFIVDVQTISKLKKVIGNPKIPEFGLMNPTSSIDIVIAAEYILHHWMNDRLKEAEE